MGRKPSSDLSLREAVIKAGIIRTRPILLTAAAFVIILDPILQGLAVSLLFGVGASTLLTLVVIPVLYYHLIGGRSSLEHTRSAPLLEETGVPRSEPTATS